jgi:hypothetical protein
VDFGEDEIGGDEACAAPDRLVEQTIGLDVMLVAPVLERDPGAPLSTNRRPGSPASRAVGSRALGNVRLVQITVEVLAQVLWESVQGAAEFEHGVLCRPADQRPDRDPDSLGLRPAALADPGVELLEILIVEIDLKGARHEWHCTRFMILPSVEP